MEDMRNILIISIRVLIVGFFFSWIGLMVYDVWEFGNHELNSKMIFTGLFVLIFLAIPTAFTLPRY